MSVENSTQQDGTTMRETQSMLLERIASEMNRLKFYMAHAQVLIISLNLKKKKNFCEVTILCPMSSEYIGSSILYLSILGI